jgi:hypothetical protein
VKLTVAFPDAFVDCVVGVNDPPAPLTANVTDLTALTELLCESASCALTEIPELPAATVVGPTDVTRYCVGEPATEVMFAVPVNPPVVALIVLVVTVLFVVNVTVASPLAFVLVGLVENEPASPAVVLHVTEFVALTALLCESTNCAVTVIAAPATGPVDDGVTT